MRIVLSRTDRVGDLILSTPAIASMRRSFPDAHITIVCSPYNSVVVENNRDVDAVDRIPDGAKPEAFGRRYAGNCDLAIALAPRTADFRLVAATRAPRRIGYTYAQRFLTRLFARRYLTDLGLSEADPAECDRRPRFVRHEVDQVLALAEMAGAGELVHDLVLPISDADRERVAYLPAGAIAVHVAPRWRRDGSTEASLMVLLSELRALGRPLVITYGEDSAGLGERIERSGLVDAAAGCLPFASWAAAFERASVVVTVDTGATHVASAMRRPTVVLFEHRYFRLNSQEWSPYRVPSAILRKPVDESPGALAASRREIVQAAADLLDGDALGAAS